MLNSKDIYIIIMLSDSCFQAVDDILQAVTDYDYSDDFKSSLLRSIMELLTIQNSLDRQGTGLNLFKNNREDLIKYATELYENAQKRRDDPTVEVWIGQE